MPWMSLSCLLSSKACLWSEWKPRQQVARELPLEDLAQYIPLESSPEIWAEAILKAANESRAHRRDTSGDIAKAGYEIKAAARDFEQFYLARAAEAGIRSDNSKAGQPSSASDEKGTEA